MDKDIHILVVDDHAVVREGIRRILEEEDGIELVGQGANSEEALFQIEMLSPDIVLSDIKMPGMDGIELTRNITQKHHLCKVILLTLYDEYLSEAMSAGAKGYLLKDIKREILAHAIREVYRGNIVIGEGIKSQPESIREKSSDSIDQESTDGLTEEIQIIIPPPIEANQLMKFTNYAEDILQARVLQVVGSWHEGTAVTMLMNNATPLEDILNKMAEIPCLEKASEEALCSEANPNLFKKALAVPRLNNRSRKAIFITLEKTAAVVAS
ncbi:response regulator transcription factor [Chloroflexota bacterium]